MFSWANIQHHVTFIDAMFFAIINVRAFFLCEGMGASLSIISVEAVKHIPSPTDQIEVQFLNSVSEGSCWAFMESSYCKIFGGPGYLPRG